MKSFSYKKRNGVDNNIISFSLSEIKNISLEPNDKVIISSNFDLTRSKSVVISGEIAKPKVIPFSME